MVEVLFGESEAGSMKIAKNIQDPDQVICLGFMLDVGDIKESVDSQYRKDLIYSMYVQDQWGRVLGVPEDFYDFLIWKRITKKPEKEAHLLGDILGNNLIGVGDWWYARRIEKLISQGKIKVIEDSEKKYARQICLT